MSDTRYVNHTVVLGEFQVGLYWDHEEQAWSWIGEIPNCVACGLPLVDEDGANGSPDVFACASDACDEAPEGTAYGRGPRYVRCLNRDCEAAYPMDGAKALRRTPPVPPNPEQPETVHQVEDAHGDDRS